MKKINTKNIILSIIFTATIVAGFGFVKVERANAADELGKCHNPHQKSFYNSNIFTRPTITENLTRQQCLDSCSDSENCYWQKNGSNNKEILKGIGKTSSSNAQNDDVCGMGFWDYFSLDLIKCLLLYVLKFIGTLIFAASTLFAWVIDVNNMKAVIDNSIIYEMWSFVRDMLNIAFILVLLFSAFCTVFQITKYSYKNILLTLIIMALLVNFSFPIARVIIDFSNVIMYYLINGLGSSGVNNGQFFLDIAKNGDLAKIVNPSPGGSVNLKSDMSFLFAAIVFTFIFMVTLVMISVLLVIRIVVLAILIIFASLAFVGSIVPFLSKYASDWWESLFKYSFFGPVMIFMMVVSTKMIAKIAEVGKGNMQIIATAKSQTAIGETIAAFAFFSIPIIILWVGMGSAQKMSIAGAGAVVGRGQKFMKWAGGGLAGNLSGYNWADRRLQSFRKERQRRRDEILKNNIGQGLARRINRAQDTAYSAAGGTFAAMTESRAGRFLRLDRLNRTLGITGAESRRRIENIHDADVREHMKTIDNISNGAELANLFYSARNDAQREAVLRRAASIGETATILNRVNPITGLGFANDRIGFTNFMTENFGENDRSARLASAVAGLEAGKHNAQYGGAATYDAATNQYAYNPAAPVGPADAPAAVQFAMAGGEHAQNVARNLRPGFLVTNDPATPPGTPPRLNADFENFLQNMGGDFNAVFLNQADQIPASVIRQLQTAIPAGTPIPPGTGPLTSQLINTLRASARLQ